MEEVQEVEEAEVVAGVDQCCCCCCSSMQVCEQRPGTAGKRAESADETRQERLGCTYSRVYYWKAA